MSGSAADPDAARDDGTLQGVALDRLLFFSDAVVAIAITLVVLPLVDSARDLGDRTTAQFLSDSGGELLAAALSFVVVGVFWRTHHRILSRARGGTNRAVTWNLVWLAGIAFLPVPTVLIVAAEGDDRAAHALYIGTMLVAILALTLEARSLQRAGLLDRSAGPAVTGWLTTLGVAAALILSIVFPGLSMWPLLILVPVGLVERRLLASAR